MRASSRRLLLSERAANPHQKRAMQLKHWIVTAAVLSAYGAGQQVRADDTADSIKALQKQIEELDQKVKTLERNRELDREASAEAAKSMPVLLAGPTGLGFRSADTNFVIKLRGVLQTDSRTFFNDHGIVGNDGFLLRRARPSLEGTVYRDFDFLFVPDFGGSSVQIFDAYLNYRNRPELQLHREVQDAGWPRAIASRSRLDLQRARPGHVARAEPGPRRATARRGF